MLHSAEVQLYRSCVRKGAVQLKRWCGGGQTLNPAPSSPCTAVQVQGRGPAKFHVLLTTYEMLMGKLDRPRLSKLKWRCGGERGGGRGGEREGKACRSSPYHML